MLRVPSAMTSRPPGITAAEETITLQADIDAPQEGRPGTVVSWLIRQLRAAPDGLRIDALAVHVRGAGTAELLKDIRENPAILIADPTKELRILRVAVSTPMGAKRGRGRGSFIDSVGDAINSFYSDVIQNLKVWTATPKMRELIPVPEEHQHPRHSPRKTASRHLIRSSLLRPAQCLSTSRSR